MADRNPVPPANDADAEDVSWALSTAEAMWTRGDRDDAVKWIRRAVESASEAGADDRALELAKAAADLASYVGPPPAPAPAPVAKAPAKVVSTPVPVRAPPPKAPAVAAPRPAAVRPAAGAPPPKGAARAARKSSASFTNEAKAVDKPRPAPPASHLDNEVTQEVRVPPAWEAKRRARASRPEATEVAVTPPAPTVAARRAPSTDEIDAWPTQSVSGADLDDEHDERTRVGEPAYDPAAAALDAKAPAASGGLQASQAVRVIVWRAADGVHVAPHGTTVSAIAVEAMLVALDPAADLAAWLAKR